MWGQIAQGVGALAGGIGGSKGQKSGGMPKFVKKQFKRGYAGLNDAAARAPTEAIAGLNADQNAGFNMIRSNIGLGAGSIQEALDKYRAASGGVGADQINKFMNPYTSSVIDAGVADIERARAREMLSINAQSEAAGAFGGDRDVVARALAGEQYGRQINDLVSGLRFSGWNSAVDSAFRNNAATTAGAGGMLNAVNAQRDAAYGDAAAQIGVGDTIRDYDQSLLDYPLKMAMMQINAAGAGSGASRSTTTGGGVSGAMSGIVGGANTGGQIYDVLKGIFG